MSTGDSSFGGNWDFYAVRRAGEPMYAIIHRPEGITEQDREYYIDIHPDAFINREAATNWVLTTNASRSSRDQLPSITPVSVPDPDYSVHLAVMSILVFLIALAMGVYLLYISM